MRLESAERVGSPSIPADLDAREAASPPSTLGGDDEASHPSLPPGTDEPSGCYGSLVGGEADPGQRAVTWQPSGCPIWEPSGSPTPRPERLSSLRPEQHPALPPGTDEPSGSHGSLVGGEADPGQRAVTWQPSGCPIQEPSGSPTLRPERTNPLRPERHRAPPLRQNEPSSCHGSLVGGEADPGPRALLLKAAAPAVADCLLVCPLATRG
ncbi:hypothetical protein EMIHUDRAFT_194747 [Emiliania huxleyi CCMP1516]|uniref:Uncharacterized protein n=2 Tax=Emiliania huxleyi TaxID=2903 RepID=A0A0D3L222_EMIH1|nr:hypothetical protein EMIHUDRAFT_194747 [Emiliania huxleyi CCMP1516]EOD42057.1 hypothetical protein EMIHUDRAFT_194747 [Emiliania huxleyi CCMP1516]|eukprot:XP_005794486.1 hypothetical protein EMIHUDRAFT_194747 [Emiliania huxleyi CCMP1516]